MLILFAVAIVNIKVYLFKVKVTCLHICSLVGLPGGTGTGRTGYGPGGYGPGGYGPGVGYGPGGGYGVGPGAGYGTGLRSNFNFNRDTFFKTQTKLAGIPKLNDFCH